MLQIHTFGGLKIARDGQALPLPAGKTRDLLAYLIFHRGCAISRDILAGTFWPEQANERARRMLSQALWQIRSALGPAAACLITKGDEVCFAPGVDDWLDVTVFEQAYSSFAENTSSDSSCLSQAVALYQADFLAGCYDDWALLAQERLRERYLEMLGWLIALYKQAGDFEAALSYARRLVAVDPLRESIHQELMRLYHLLGRERAALEQYETLRRVLASELRVEPSAATVVLAREIADRLGETELPYLPPKARPMAAFDRPERIPLVGRDEERSVLLALLQVVYDGRGGLLLVEGEPGVGKTRLMHELAQDAQWRGMQVCWGRGQELAELPPYSLIHDALRDALSPLRASQLKTLMKAHWLRDAGLILPVLAEWLPDLPPRIPLEPGQERTRLLESVTQTILALGQILPHVLIFDDLQWADAASMSALSYLAGRLAQSRILVVVCYRGEEVRQRPATWEALLALDQIGGRRRLLLARLNAGQATEFVRRGLGIFTGSSVFEQRLYQETDGNPLFLLETLRALQEDGQLYQDETGAWNTSWEGFGESEPARGQLPGFAQPTGTGLSLPAGVCQVINRRLAALSADEMAVIKMVAVLGGDCDFTLLSCACQLDAQAMLSVLSRLLWQRFLVEGLHTYRFSHDKTREVVYVGIDEAQRQALHRQAGQALARVHPGQVEQLARHFYLAQVWEKAFDYSWQAGQHARAIYAYADAVVYYTQALEACEYLSRPGAKLNLYQERGVVYREVGKFDQAEADLRAAYNLAKKAGDTAGQACALNTLSGLQIGRGDFAASLENARLSADLAAQAGRPDETAAALSNRVNALCYLGDYQAAIVFGKQAVALSERLSDPARQAAAYDSLGRTFLFNGSLVEARLFLERALVLYRRLDDKVSIARSLVSLSQLYVRYGDFLQAQETAGEAQEICSSIGHLSGEAFALACLGEAVREQGRIDSSISFFQRALHIAREIGERAKEQTFLKELARAYHFRGDLAQAEEMLRASIALSAVRAIAHDVPLAHAYLALLLLETGRAEEALFHATTGLQMSVGRKERLMMGVLHGVMAQAAAQLGRRKTAENPTIHFEKSIHILRTVGFESELARSQVAYGLYLTRLAGAGQAERGAVLLGEGRAAFERLGMARDLAALEATTTAGRPPHQIGVRLPRAGVPGGRPLREEEYVNVTWTLSVPGDDEIPGKSARRQHRLLRLLQEAAERSAAPTVPDLAAALGVNARTIRRDLAALRAAEKKAHTRGSRAVRG
ncbi:MAG: AAA family ATPase [Chloroflexota bacterium]